MEITIVTRGAKGSALTYGELDQNFENLKAATDTVLNIMTEAQFNALAAANRDKFAGSGFVEWGKHGIAGEGTVNKGMWTPATGWGQPNVIRLGRDILSTDANGTSKTDFPLTNVNGVILNLENQSNNTEDWHIELPPAPAVSTMPERQDLVFLETWHEKISDKDIVYPLGNVQSLLAVDPATGLTTVNGSFIGFGTYSLFGNWQASSALIGKGIVWSTMTLANQRLFVADPENNCYLASDGGLVQVRCRIRVVEGLGIDYALTSTSVFSQGSNAAPTINNYTLDTVDKGLYNSTDSVAIQIALVSRRNQGAFHPVFNPNGAAKFGDALPWYSSADLMASVADCFTTVGNGSTIGAASGRPDGKFYDAIYESDVLDLRNSAHKQDLTRTLEREFNKLVSGDMRGWEKGRKISEVVDYVINPLGIYTPTIGTVTYVNAIGVVSKIYGVASSTSVVGMVEGNSGAYYRVMYADPAGSIHLSAEYGDVQSDFDQTTTRTLVIFEDVIIPSKTNLVCDIIGDPANYPASWKANGVMGNALLVGEEGENLIPTAGLLTYKLRKKAKSAPLFFLHSADSGATWTSYPTWISTYWNATTNSIQTIGIGINTIMMVFYEAEASPFELANNAEVLSFDDIWAGNNSDIASNLLPHLIDKVAVGSGGLGRISTKTINHFLLESDSSFYATAPYELTHGVIDLYASNPATKVLPYLTRENGKLFLQALYKEMKWDLALDTTIEFIYADGAVSTAYTAGSFYLVHTGAIRLAVKCLMSVTAIFAYYDLVGGYVQNNTGTKVWQIWDGNGWGDDNKFDVVSNESTTTDDNGQTIKIGQKRLELPYFIGDGE